MVDREVVDFVQNSSAAATGLVVADCMLFGHMLEEEDNLLLQMNLLENNCSFHSRHNFRTLNIKTKEMKIKSARFIREPVEYK